MSRKRTVERRATAVTEKPWNGHGLNSLSHVLRVYMRRDDRETIRRLYAEYGIVYTKTKRELRVAFKIPWGVDFDVRNPAACPEAGTWDGHLEILKDVLEVERERLVREMDPRRN